MDKNQFAEFSQELDKMSGEDILKGIYKELKKEHKQIAVNAIRRMLSKYKKQHGVNSADNSVYWFEHYTDKLEKNDE